MNGFIIWLACTIIFSIFAIIFMMAREKSGGIGGENVVLNEPIHPIVKVLDDLAESEVNKLTKAYSKNKIWENLFKEDDVLQLKRFERDGCLFSYKFDIKEEEIKCPKSSIKA